MPYEFKLQRRVEFAETDMAGIVHFSNFFRFMEATEHAFVRSLGQTLHANGAGGAMYGWARVRAECDYKAPLHYQDLFEVRLRVSEKRSSTLAYDFAFRLMEAADGTPQDVELAIGRLVVVCVERGATGERLRSAPIPEELARLITVAPDSP